jgi:hypothetical protein
MNRFQTILTCAAFIVAAACQQKSGEHQQGSDDIEQNAPNQALYEQVMTIHDEVMPKMNDLYKRKTTLKTRLALPGISEAEKEEINLNIARIDSASESMMVWMRQFDPVADSEGEEKARAYLEAELVKVKKVREDILEALRAAQ